MAVTLYVFTLLSNIFLSFYRNKKNSVIFISITILALLAGFASTKEGDLYYYQLEYYQAVNTPWEMGYLWISSLFRTFGVSFEIFHTFVMLISILFFMYGMKSLTGNTHLVIALFSVVIFPFLAIAMRFCIASSIVTIGFKYLEKKNTRSIIIYLFIILIASLFHTSVLFAVLFAIVFLPERLRRYVKKALVGINVVAILFILVMMVIPSISIYLSSVIVSISSILFDSFAEMTLRYVSQGFSRSYILYSLLFLMFYLLVYCSKKVFGGSDPDIKEKIDKNHVIILLSMLIMPALIFDRSIIRIQFWGLYLCFAMYANVYTNLLMDSSNLVVGRIALRPKQYLGFVYVVSFIWFNTMYISGGLGFDMGYFLGNNTLFR